MTAPAAARIPEQLLANIRDRLPVLDVVQRHVRMTRTGAWWKGLCPFHSEKGPSFSVHPQRRNFHCFGCGAHGDVIGFVRRLEGGLFRDVVARLAAEAGLETEFKAAARAPDWAPPARPAAAAPPRPDSGPTPANRTAWARRAWDEARPIAEGSPQAAYLAGRWLWPLPASAHLVLRAATLRHKDTGEALHPVLLARVDAPDATLVAVHRTFLGPDAAGGWGKLRDVENAKLLLGPMAGGAIRLFPVAEALGLAEGIETALAASLLRGGMPVWACVSAGGLEAVELPFDVAAVTVFADRDRATGHAPEGRGLQAANNLARRLKPLAVRGEVRLPRAPAGDYADVWAAMQGEAA